MHRQRKFIRLHRDAARYPCVVSFLMSASAGGISPAPPEEVRFLKKTTQEREPDAASRWESLPGSRKAPHNGKELKAVHVRHLEIGVDDVWQ